MTMREARHTTRLGPAFTIEVDAPGALGDDVVAAVLDEEARLAAVFDSADPDSEIARWRRGEVPDPELSTDLSGVLAASERFWAFSKGAFHPGGAVLTQRWRAAEREGVPPTREEMLRLARALELPYTAVNGPITRTGDCSYVDISSISRGYIIDRALDAGWQLGLATALGLESGGDRRHRGDPGVLVDPAGLYGDLVHGLTEPLPPLLLQDAALSHKSRHVLGFEVGGVRYGDVIDPSTGWPCDEIVAVAALAADSMTADVLATVIGVGRSLAGGGQPGSAWLAVLATGEVLHSENWPHVGRSHLAR